MSYRNRPALPTSWDAYEHGRASSFGSLESVPEDEQRNGPFSSTSTFEPGPGRTTNDGNPSGLRRTSSLGRKFDSLRFLGGPNSIDNFARSLQRAAAFREITPVRRLSVSVAGDNEEGDGDIGEQSTPEQSRSLLRAQLNAYHIQNGSEDALQDDPSEAEQPNEGSRLIAQEQHQAHKSTTSLLGSGPLLGSQLGTSYGSISSKLTPAARRRASILIVEQEETNRLAKEHPEEFRDEPPRELTHDVLPDGEVIARIVGRSTVPMTVFNSTNVLIGVGILALPLGVRYSGWIMGLGLLTLAAISTAYTAKLLAKCLDTNTGSTTYGDIAFLAFDTWGRNFVEALFILELTAANVALVILFADSMNSLLSGVGLNEWKALIALGLIPLNFVPFRALSVTSVIGIFCCFGIIIIVFVDGLIKPHTPGSLREMAATYAFPEDWRTLPLSLGLFMAPWGGHSVFPAIYKDMRHPQKYGRAVKYTYIFTYGLDVSMAVLGYLMFGDKVRDEVTSNILRDTFYPHALSFALVVLICIIPITKVPLSNRPIMDTLNKKFRIDLREMDPKARLSSQKNWRHRAGRVAVAILVNLLPLAIAIGFPDFDSIMALMGSAFCFTICIILPVSFHLKIFSTEDKGISLVERIVDWTLVIVCSVLAVLGTVFAILPKEKIGLSS